MMAWMVFEVGKNWAEADGDIAELIDFTDFYALEALRLSKAEPPVQLPGERDYLRYIPLGVGAVIPPWNFPAAIMGGMTLASVVAGNTVILKPSGDSPTIAAKFFEILEEAGLPDGVVNFCPGHGNSFGNSVVEHPKTRYIAFTGSKEVGLHINQRAAVQQPGQLWIKRTILEMGGKDSIIVDADADLDAAVEGVASAAFGFSGQKCSACSRAIIDERVYDKFLQRLKERVEKITVGDPTLNPNMGPVINEKSMKSILGYIQKGIAEGGRLITGGERCHRRGRGLLPSAHRHCRRRSHGHHLAAGDLRPGAGRHQVNQLRARAAKSPTTPSSASPARSIPPPTTRSRRPSSSSTSATCTSIASARARWWARIPSAASICREPTRRRAARITCCCSRRQNPSGRRSQSSGQWLVGRGGCSGLFL